MSSNTPEPSDRPDSSEPSLAGLIESNQSQSFVNARRVAKWGALLLVLGVAGYFVWQWANSMAGMQREAPKLTMVIPLPPPPPPPPEPEKPPEPEEPKEEKVVEPEPVPEPTPVDDPKPKEDAPPSPSDDLADPMQMNADAQAGNDSFNIGAGQGRGMAGGGGGGRVGNATYSQYLAYALQKILRSDDRTKNLAYRLNVDIWLNASGQVSRVELTRTSGDAEIDAKVIAALRAVPALDERPPASVVMPIRASLTSRRPT